MDKSETLIKAKFFSGDDALFAEFDITKDEESWTSGNERLQDVLNTLQPMAALQVDKSASQNIDLDIVRKTLKIMGYGVVVSAPKVEFDPDVVY